MLLCYLLPAVPLPLILLVEMFLQVFLVADSLAMRNEILCALKCLSKNSAGISCPETVFDQRKVIKLSQLASSPANR